MLTELIECIKDIKDDVDLASASEKACRQYAIDPVLSALGWRINRRSEVHVEFEIGNRRVDYCLKLNDKPKVFIEAKKTEIDLENEDYQKQLLDYAFAQGVRLAVLTNGYYWHLYYPITEGNWKNRRFCMINIKDDDIESVSNLLDKYLSRRGVETGSAVTDAKIALDNVIQTRVIKETIPKAWNQMLAEADDFLIELLREKVEGMCGYKPEANACANFLINKPALPIYHNDIVRVDLPVATETTNSVREKAESANSFTITFKGYSDIPNFDFTQLTAFTFCGQTRRVNYWWELLVSICELIYKDKTNDFSKAFDKYGNQVQGFSYKKSDLRQPKQIPGSNIFVSVSWRANNHVRRTLKIMEIFGYKLSDLTIEYSADSNARMNPVGPTSSKELVPFEFLGYKYESPNRRDVSRRLCELLTKKHPDKADLLLRVQGRQHKYFSQSKFELQEPKLIPGTNIYLSNKLTTWQWESLEPKILKLFGYGSSDFKILKG
jgi:predicted type IV restriction endonuclease